jgi:hypothetical protein
MPPQSSRNLYFDISRTLPTVLILKPDHTPSSVPPYPQIFLTLPFSFTFTREAFLGPISACDRHSQIYVTTDCQSASLSWCQAPIWGPRPHFYCCQLRAGPLWREDESVVYNCCWSSPAQSFSAPSSAGLMMIFSQIRGSPNMEGQFPLFTSPRNRLARLYPHVLESLFFASYESQDYGGGIRTRLHTGTCGCLDT